MNNIVSGILGNTLRRYLVIALAVTFAVTSGMFAYAFSTTNITLVAGDATADFADITPSSGGGPTFTTFGNYRGAIPAADIFDVTPETNYSTTGDLGVIVYLNNIDQIGYKYSMFMVRVNLIETGGDGGSMDKDALDNGAGDKVLSLHNGTVSFISDNMTGGTTYYITIKGGVYRTYPWSFLNSGGSGGSYAPSFTAEVVQAGL